jgi:hypothetical protein
MPLIFITFIFRLPSQPGKTFYGKYYTDSIPPDHAGLDEVIRTYLTRCLPEEEVQIGILSVSNEKYIAIHASDKERQIFDFYCEKFSINYVEILKTYLFGKVIP